MALSVWQRHAVDEAGNVLPEATVEVRDDVSGALVQLYSDPDGSNAIGNPITANEDGFIQFYTKAGVYNITASLGGASRTWSDEEIGAPHRRTAAEISAGVTPVDYRYPELHPYRYGTNTTPGSTNMASAIQAAINVAEAKGGGTVPLPPAVLGIGSTLLLPSKVTLEGAGANATEIKVLDGSNVTAVQSKGFDALTGQNKWFTADGVPYSFGLKQLTINGNKANNASGSGVQFYGKNYIVDEVLIRDCADDSFYSEAGSVTGQQNYTDMPESYIKRLMCRAGGGRGFVFLGPHNALIGHVISAFHGDWGAYIATDGHTTYDGNADEVVCLHTYANAGDKGIFIDTVVRANVLITDGDNLEFGSNAAGTRVNRVRCANAGGERDAITISGSNIGIDNITISMADPVGATKRNAITIDGNATQIGMLFAGGNGRSNDGVVINGNRTQITALEIREFNGDDGLVLNASDCFISGWVGNCTNCFNYMSGSRNRVRLHLFTAPGQTAVDGNDPGISDRFEISATGAVSGRTWAAGNATVASGTTSIAVAHGLLYTPALSDINVKPNEDPNVNWWVENPTSTQFTIAVESDPGEDITFSWNARIN